MTVELQEVPLEDIKDAIAANLRSYGAPVDSYYEDHVLESKQYRIIADSAIRGYASVFSGSMITQFSLDGEGVRRAPEIFDRVAGLGLFSEMYVPTADPLFLALALDNASAVEAQDFVFQASADVMRPAAGFALRKAVAGDKDFIKARDDDFFKNADRNIADGELHIGEQDGEPVSFGIVERSKLLDGVASLGMFVIGAHRGRNFGAMTIAALIGACAGAGITPVAGCFAKNLHSRAALEKAGMYSVTRLLKVALKTR